MEKNKQIENEVKKLIQKEDKELELLKYEGALKKLKIQAEEYIEWYNKRD